MRQETGNEPASGREFAAEATAPQRWLIGEMFAFRQHTRKWWLAPVLLLLLLVGLLVVLGGTAVAPFMYTLS